MMASSASVGKTAATLSDKRGWQPERGWRTGDAAEAVGRQVLRPPRPGRRNWAHQGTKKAAIHAEGRPGAAASSAGRQARISFETGEE